MCYLDPDLQGAAVSVATILRGKGQSVDLVLENKSLKWYIVSSLQCLEAPYQQYIFSDLWSLYISFCSFFGRVFKRAARINACRLILVGSSEWQKGEVRVKNLSTGEQYEIKVDKLE